MNTKNVLMALVYITAIAACLALLFWGTECEFLEEMYQYLTGG